MFKDITKMEHNKKAKSMISKAIKSKKIFCCCNCTGSGKSYQIKQMIPKLNKPLLITPDKDIIKNLSIPTMTYAKFVKPATITWIKKNVDSLVFDEAHHMASEKCSRVLEKKLNKMKRYGFTATPIRMDGINIVDKYFNSNNITTLTIQDAWKKDIFKKPDYIVSVLHKERNKNNKVIKGKKGYKAVPIAEQSINKTFKNYIKGRQKIVVYCSTNDDMEYLYNILESKFCKYGFKCFMYSDKHNNYKIFKEFEKAETSKLVMFSINKLIEGHHITNLDCLFMYRQTESIRIVSQMLGRICHHQSNFRPIVIDMVKNAGIYLKTINKEIKIHTKLGDEIQEIAHSIKYEVDYNELGIDISKIFDFIDENGDPIINFNEYCKKYSIPEEDINSFEKYIKRKNWRRKVYE